MLSIHGNSEWLRLSNPFFKITNNAEVITGHVSGRNTDIIDIVTGRQSAIILASAPKLGKTALLRYLQRPPEVKWSWRNEWGVLRKEFGLDDVHFILMDLTLLQNADSPHKLLNSFIKEAITAIYKVYRPQEQPPFTNFDYNDFSSLLRTIHRANSEARYILMLDTINRLGQYNIHSSQFQNEARASQDRGFALLDTSGIISTLVNLVDEFSSFGVILAIESLPRPNSDYQFSRISAHLSAEMAHFETMVLHIFTWNDARAFLAQEPQDFGEYWAESFRALGGSSIFSSSEQIWLYEQAGSHPYLLQQLCYQAFRLKQNNANIENQWTDLSETDRERLIERVNDSLSTFLGYLWKRVQEALDSSSTGTKNKFIDFIHLLEKSSSTDQILDTSLWSSFGKELHYILYSEGILCDEKEMHLPGSLLRTYLIRKTKEDNEWFASSTTTAHSSNTQGIQIMRPTYPADYLSLSDIEYRLIKLLLQPPYRYTEDELKKATWNEPISSRAFAQRMHHLRKKLKDRCDTEIIENRYGGIYMLTHPDWFTLTH